MNRATLMHHWTVELPAADPATHRDNATRFPRDRLGDEQLVHAAGTGDPEAWEELWKRHHRSVRRVLGSCLGNDSAIDDLAQDAFLALFRSLDQVRKPQAVRGYLMGTAARLAAQEIRTRGRRFKWLRLSPTGTLPEIPLWEDHDTNERMQALAQVLGTLSPELRGIFVLRFVEEMGSQEIADSMGFSESTAKRLIRKARDRVLLSAKRSPALAGWVLDQELSDDL